MRRDYAGAAQAAQLTQNLGNSTADLTIYCTDLTGWPTGTGSKPFYVVIDRGTASEEKILCASRSGNVLTVFDNGVVNGRAADDTSITSHSTNAVIEHVFTATDADEANAHVNASSGVHGLSGSVVGTTDTQTLSNKTLTTPTIANFTNAQHDHGDADDGGNIAIAAVTGLQTALDGKANLSGATFTGEVDVVSATAAGSTSVRQITVSTADPTGGADGDIWVKYV